MPVALSNPTVPYHSVYALFCQDGAHGPGYVKFGHTQDLDGRLSAIRTACPVPAKMMAFVEIGPNRELTKRVERAIHHRFHERRMRRRGEWFRFDFADPEDKQDFNEGTREVLSLLLGPKHPWWSTVSVAALDKERERRQAAFLCSPKGRKALRVQNAKRRYGAAE